MKYKNTKSIFILFAVLFVSLSLFVSCEETLMVGKIDESSYTTPENTIGYLVSGKGKKNIDFIEFRNEGEADIYLSLTKNVADNSVVTMRYNAQVLEKYNEDNDADFVLFPEELVSFENDLTVSKDNNKSEKGIVKFLTDDRIDSNTTYAIPISTELKSGNITLSETDSDFLLLVKDFSKLPGVEKSTGIEIISCMEINDTNPLNNLCFTLKNSNKLLVDQVILFSANINYNKETGKVYVYNNPNVEHILSNREKYLKPLQDRGVKIILGILGNHDIAGVANLSDETAQLFAQELKAICYSYNLDGVFFDDEYSDYYAPRPPGFLNSPSSQAAARLCYETKRAMPDKYVQVYVYSRTVSLSAVDGVPSGHFVDYALHDYGGAFDLSRNFEGMPKSRMGMYSQEFNRGYWTSQSNLVRMRNDGYGTHMIFAMDPLRNNSSSQISAMSTIAETLFDDELVVDYNFYKKDW